MRSLVALIFPSVTLAFVGQFVYHSDGYPPLCVDLDTPHLPTSAVNLTPCLSSSSTQYWHIHPENFQITSYPWGHTCLTIAHPEDLLSGEFSRQPILATSCEYVQSRRGSAQGQPDGFQKLVWTNSTLTWRGQSKTLPQALDLRYCIEVQGSPDATTVLSLEHCVQDKEEQQFDFEENAPEQTQ
jgi:hypothetical protein